MVIQLPLGYHTDQRQYVCIFPLSINRIFIYNGQQINSKVQSTRADAETSKYGQFHRYDNKLFLCSVL